MKDLIYSAASLVLGFILGVLTLISAFAGLALWLYVEEKPKKRSKYRTDYTRPRKMETEDVMEKTGGN